MSVLTTALMELAIAVYLEVKSLDKHHPFYSVQKLNFSFFIGIGVTTATTILNLIPLISFIASTLFTSDLMKLIFSPAVVTCFMSFFHFITAQSLLMMYMILAFKSGDYFAISKYEDDANIKLLIDATQRTLSCCGRTNGSRDWTEKVPASCCEGKSCPPGYVTNRSCLWLLSYVLGLPMLMAAVAILICVCVGAWALLNDWKDDPLPFSTAHDEKEKPERPVTPMVRPQAHIPRRFSPHYLNRNPNSDWKPPLVESSFLKGDQAVSSSSIALDSKDSWSWRSPSRVDYCRTLEDDQFFCARVQRMRTISETDQQTRARNVKHVSYSLPSHCGRQNDSDSDTPSKDLKQALEACISAQRRITRSKSIDEAHRPRSEPSKSRPTRKKTLSSPSLRPNSKAIKERSSPFSALKTKFKNMTTKAESSDKDDQERRTCKRH